MPPVTNRVRSLRACANCAQRKIKCDGTDTCSSCQKLGTPCLYMSSGKKRGPPKGCPPRGGVKKKTVRFDYVWRIALGVHLPRTRTLLTLPSPQAPPHPSTPTTPTTLPPSSLTPSAHDAHSTEQIFTHSPATEPLRLQQPFPPPRTPHEGPSLVSPLSVHQPPSFLPQAPHPSGGQPSADIITDLLLNNSPLNSGTTVNDGVIDPSRRLSATFTPMSGSNAPSTVPSLGLSEQLIDEFLLIYETFIHPHWPIVYLPALRSPRMLEKHSPLVFDAIISITAANTDLAARRPFGLTDAAIPFGSLPAMSESIIESVRQRILASFCHSSDLDMIQALIIVSLVDIGAGRTSLACQMCGIACRMAVDLGMHMQDDSDLGSKGPISLPRAGGNRRKQEQSRTVWACFVLDKALAALQQRPPMLRRADIDVQRPSVMERDELDLWLAGGAQTYLTPEAAIAMESVKSHALSSFSAWCDVMAILETILDQVYRPAPRRARIEDPTSSAYYDSVVRIDAQLRQWRTTLPEHLQWSDNDESAHDEVGPHLLTCRGWYYICKLLLHRPRVPYLDTADSPDADAIEALHRLKEPESAASHVRLPKGVDATRDAANGICEVAEAYQRTFKVQTYPSSWVYLVFQAATVHAGLASHNAQAVASLHSPARQQSTMWFDRCISWLEHMRRTWASAGHHVDILRQLNAVGARTRPPSPVPHLSLADTRRCTGPAVNSEVPSFFSSPTGLSVTIGPEAASSPGIDPSLMPAASARAVAHHPQTLEQNDINSWMLFWASMPAALPESNDDYSLWQQCLSDPTL